MDVRRWFALAFVVFGGALALTACHGHSHTFTVTTTVDGGDLSPGDGHCEMTAGVGDCSLRAAVDEANTTPGDATINVPAGHYVLSLPGGDDTNDGGDLDVNRSGTLNLTGLDAGASIEAPARDGVLDNRGGRLALNKISASGASGPGVVVRTGAAATVSFSAVHHNSGAGLLVEPGATANALHATFSANGAGGVRVDGTFVADYVTVTANTAGGITGAGASTIGQSIVAQQATGANCAVPATSGNWNTSNDASCGWSGAADVSAGTWPLQPLSADLVPFHVPVTGSLLIDSIPADSGVCGTVFKNLDQRGATRPTGHGCDRGAIEAGGLALVVTTASDVLDAVPGDGICDIGNGNCTVRAAVAEANAHAGPDTITLAASPVLNRAGASEHANLTGDLDVLDSLTIDGDGHTIDGGQVDRVLEVRNGWLDLRDAAITGGRTPTSGSSRDGGGIAAATPSLGVALADVEVWGNTANGGGFGGGIFTSGTGAVVERSVIRNNSATRGGGLRAETARIVDSTIMANTATDGAGVYTRSSLEVLRSTISGNTATQNGGGIYAFECLNPTGACPAHARITSSTISGNTAKLGGALYREAPIGFAQTTFLASTVVDNVSNGVTSTGQPGSAISAQGSTTFGATIVANSTGRDCAYPATTSLGRNLGEDGTCGFGAGDLPATDPLLGPLAFNGGPTRTHLPYAISPVLDAVPAGTAGLCDATLPIDQRGQPRPAGGGCDVGAVEGRDPRALPMALVVDTAADGADLAPGDTVCAAASGCTLRAAIDEINASPHPLNRITIAAGVTPTLSLAGIGEDSNATGDLDVLAPVTIVGGGATVDAAGIDRVLDIASTGVVIERTTVRGGLLPGDFAGGGIQVRAGGLTLDRSTVADNRLTGDGGLGAGIAAQPSTTVVVRQSSLLRNVVSGWNGRGGAIYAYESNFSLLLSTVSGNQAFLAAGVEVASSLAVVNVRATTFVANNGWYTLTGGGRLSIRGSVVGPGTHQACLTATGADGTSTSFDASCGFAPAFSNVDPLLGPLADNGGPTLTHRPLLESPLRDRIVPGADCELTSPVDQRGQPRPQGTGCDIGSVESP